MFAEKTRMSLRLAGDVVDARDRQVSVWWQVKLTMIDYKSLMHHFSCNCLIDD